MVHCVLVRRALSCIPRLFRPSERHELDRLDIRDLFVYNHVVHQVEVAERKTFTMFTYLLNNPQYNRFR